jgi:hypothetical protein
MRSQPQSGSWMPREGIDSSAPQENRARIVSLTAGPGRGLDCDYCHKSIGADSVDYEVEAHYAGGLRVLHFHRICHHLWEAA